MGQLYYVIGMMGKGLSWIAVYTKGLTFLTWYLVIVL